MAKKNSALTAAIAERISAKRKEMKLTQEQAADLSGLSHPYYACVERGAKGLGADSIVKVCTALDVSPDYLLTGAMTHSEQLYVIQMMKILNEEQRNAAEEIIKNLLTACGYELPSDGVE